MILVIEIIAACLLFTVITIAGTKKDPLSGLHNMPLNLQAYNLRKGRRA